MNNLQRSSSPPGTQAMLDAIPGGAALIDGAGLIAATNNGWTAIWTSAEIPPYGIGSDYLAICRNLHLRACRPRRCGELAR